tara:strand:- start:2136 stop:2777 length:642 start_codon:yes stop_codon:yes gene_type:complete
MRIFGRKIGKKFKQREFDSGSNDENKNNNGSKIIGIPENQKRTSRPKEEAAVVKSKSVKSVNSSNEATSTLKPRTGKEPAKVKQSKLGRKERKSLEKDVKSAQAAEFRANKKTELESAKKAQVTKQKKVTKDKDIAKAAKTYEQGKQLGTKKGTTKTKEQYKSATKKNDTAKTNKVAASKVKVGKTYKRTMPDGSEKEVIKRPPGYKASKASK